MGFIARERDSRVICDKDTTWGGREVELEVELANAPLCAMHRASPAVGQENTQDAVIQVENGLQSE